jgi:hypothetical protein
MNIMEDFKKLDDTAMDLWLIKRLEKVYEPREREFIGWARNLIADAQTKVGK